MPSPNGFYRQHHQVEEPQVDATTFRQAWRVHTTLDRLLRNKQITVIAWSAATRLRDAAEAIAATGPRAVVAHRTRSGGGGGTVLRIDAMRLVARARAGLGPVSFALVYACAVDNLPWAAIGRHYQIDPQTARRRTVAALEKLPAVLKGG